MEYVTRDYIRKHREILFIFGDNILEKGFGGQARECRGEPNALGVPTKKEPSMHPEAFFKDEEYNSNTTIIRIAVKRIKAAIDSGRYSDVVILPDIGKGLSRLDTIAPLTYAYLKQALDEIREYSNSGGQNGKDR